MKRLSLVGAVVLFLLLSVGASAQTFTFGVDYGRQSLKPNFQDPISDVNSVRATGLVRVAGDKEGNGFKFKVGGEFQRTYEKEVFSNYMGTGMDIYRDVNSYFGVGELEYRVSAIGIGARAYLGTEKLHEDLEYVLARKYQFRGTLYLGKHLGLTPLFIEFKKEKEGFQQGFGAGASISF